MAVAMAFLLESPVVLAEPSGEDSVAVESVQDGLPEDGINRDAPDFVTASLLVMGPGDELYSCAGHAALRMECPAYNLDFCFSYESESVRDKVLTFFRGKLKMGMFAIPTGEYLKNYRESGRGVTQYRLNLPIAVKRSLWEILDNKVSEGAELPYDFLKRGCAQSVLGLIQTALGANHLKMQVESWPERYSWTLREFVNFEVTEYPWNLFFLNTLVGIETDRDLPKINRIILPHDLLDFLRTAHVADVPVITEPGVELLPQGPASPKPWVTPMMVACLFAALSVAYGFLRWRGISILFLSIQSLAGLFFSYLVFVSDLPATSWNWLVVPFNLLPLVFWKWRRQWALWFARVLVVWLAYMLLAPHRLTDPAYLVLVGAYAVFYATMGLRDARQSAPVMSRQGGSLCKTAKAANAVGPDRRAGRNVK